MEPRTRNDANEIAARRNLSEGILAGVICENRRVARLKYTASIQVKIDGITREEVFSDGDIFSVLIHVIEDGSEDGGGSGAAGQDISGFPDREVDRDIVSDRHR